jgi:hypothetical protein
MTNTDKTEAIKDMSDEELKKFRYEESIIGSVQECLIVDVYSQSGHVIAIPMDDEAKKKAGNEAVAIIIQKYRKSQS